MDNHYLCILSNIILPVYLSLSPLCPPSSVISALFFLYPVVFQQEGPLLWSRSCSRFLPLKGEFFLATIWNKGFSLLGEFHTCHCFFNVWCNRRYTNKAELNWIELKSSKADLQVCHHHQFHQQCQNFQQDLIAEGSKANRGYRGALSCIICQHFKFSLKQNSYLRSC